MRVRCDAVYPRDSSAADRVIGLLSAAGIVIERSETSTTGIPRMLLFGSVDALLFRMLRDVNYEGLDRVLAVALPGCNIPGALPWKLLQNGASDVLCWDRLHDPVLQIASKLERWAAVEDIIDSSLVADNLIGRSPAWIAELRRLVEVARFTDASVLISGETGTGKELLARLVHTLDPRPKKGHLVVVDCTTIVPELSGSEFFGHEKGAYTGANGERDGAFALANGGTLFLDEIGDLPLGLQAQMLRAVQEQMYKRVGGNDWKRTEFRLVCAANRDLLRAVERGEFRRDLYYRIAGWIAHPPRLAERREDILPLVRHFLEKASPAGAAPELDDAVSRYFRQREYPGNIRDLRQLVNRVCYRHVGPGPITVGDIPEDERPSLEEQPEDWRGEPFDRAVRNALASGVGLKEISRATADLAVRIAVASEGGNLKRAARRLGVTDRALQLRRAEYRQHRMGAGA